jgi:hypothetical protein
MQRKALYVTVTMLIALVTAAPAHAAGGNNARICLPVLATGVGQDNFDFTTDATIRSHGILLGTTHAEFTPTGGTPPTVTFTGPIDFTTAIGTLTAQVAGSVNTATGAFASQSTSLSGTGAFRGVTGSLKLVGTENLQTGAFTETITGRLCAPFPHA